MRYKVNPELEFCARLAPLAEEYRANMSVLGDLPPEQFLADYWQQQPLLLQGALADFDSPISAEELAGMALEPGAGTSSKAFSFEGLSRRSLPKH